MIWISRISTILTLVEALFLIAGDFVKETSRQEERNMDTDKQKP